MPYLREPTRVRWMRTLACIPVLALLLATSASAQVSLPIDLPGVTLGNIDVLSPSSARISATVDPAVAGTTAFVEYRGLDGLIKRRPITLSASLDPQDVTLDLDELLPGSAYEARIVATNPGSTALGGASGQSALTDFRAFRTDNAVVDRSTGALVAGASPAGAVGKGRVRCTKLGTARADRLRGTRGKDVICGLGGADKIYGLSGNDTLIGGAGNDTIVGGKGRDRMMGDAGRDRISARDRTRDYVNGGSGSDRASVDTRKGRDAVRSVERGVKKARRARR